MRTTPRLVLDKQDKLKTDFYFKAMAVGFIQLMYIWQKKKERLSMLAYLSKTCHLYIYQLSV